MKWMQVHSRNLGCLWHLLTCKSTAQALRQVPPGSITLSVEGDMQEGKEHMTPGKQWLELDQTSPVNSRADSDFNTPTNTKLLPSNHELQHHHLHH